jgi:small subunit ribosomal protein S9
MVKTYNVKASRKTAKARAVIKSGSGKIRVNKNSLDAFVKGYKKSAILEPTHVAADEFKKFDYFVNVSGGGVSGQVQAVRSCISKGILLANGSKKVLRDKLVKYNRYFLIDDVRNTEPKKQLGRGARKMKQKSKR